MHMLQRLQKYGRVWRHLCAWRGNPIRLRGHVVVVFVIIVTQDNDSFLQGLPLHVAVVAFDVGFALDDILRFTVRERTFRMAIH